ncbi:MULTISPECIES: SoxY-related AACIE arm protein [Methylobacterium]|jgi:sulfur-oxidizing protein SoxY|uniref:Sulfur oxidation protein SoxY n=2 Tax=Methylobacterium TaxID=407 RepID=A0A0C6FH37_9HYPH|nr:MULTISPECIES: SoxY-related AACIE arm protein [Methylobacterium]MBZ6413383.1 SoxY-related AACIE arm protein [Methylobacterium sp.]MBK3397870.1 SoxY-related AACIE arm protein [Methylobacterium ajmalii]MBK3408760.1 SoxY-related AACIE arm protein [Methylobacterium ajmalii]MBK3425919.1 SoxY-related AACIE arm protein [Methylobacterium ajmalii]SFE83111.1 sulfur-oxidizing protein SoxY [Methylobacterium sp. yr596]
MTAVLDRRTILAGGAGLLTVALVRPGKAAIIRPTREATVEAIRRFTGGAAIRTGRIHLDMPPLVENGNTVPLAVTVESPMSETDFVHRIAVFNDKNPQPHVVTLHLGPRAGRAAVNTRIRLADSQTITAIAEMRDGTYWSATADAIVTLAACVEGS